MSQTSIHNTEYVNSLRLSDQEAAEILEILGRRRSDPPSKNRRTEERVPYHHQTGLIVKMHHPGGSIANHLVRVRNLSSGGVGFLHGSFVHHGTRCTIVLRTRTNKSISATGRVVRCEYVRGHVHEVGLQFDRPIQLEQFVASALRMSSEVEASKELPQLSGTVMYVEDSLSDQELLAFHLGNVGVKVKAVADVLTAVELIEVGKYDAVLTNMLLPTLSGLELVDFLRQKNYTGPIIAFTVDGRQKAQDDAMQHGCTGVLVKPYQFESLFALLEPHLASKHPASEQVLSELWPDERMRPLIRNFLVRLRSEIRDMERLVVSDSRSAVLRKLCMEVKGSAGGYGFPHISAMAEDLLELFLNGVTGDTVHAAFLKLAELCHRACNVLDSEAAAANASAPGETTPSDNTKVA